MLAEQFGYSDGDFHFKSPQITNWKSFQPIKNTNDIRVALTRACWDDPAYTLKEWRGEVQFRAKPDVVYIDRKPVPVYPDGFCVVATQQTRTHNFIESDNGTEGLRQVVRQMQIYLEYTQSGLYEKAFGTHFWRVLLVTNSKRRLDNVRKRIAEIGGGINFWFTTADRISPQAILAQPIWYGIRGEEQHPFMGS